MRAHQNFICRRLSSFVDAKANYIAPAMPVKKDMIMNIRKIILIWFYLIFITIGSAFAESIDDMSFYTEEYPPYNFLDNGVPKGFTVDILMEMLKLLHSGKNLQDIEFRPCANSYRKLETEKNVCLFGTTRTDERNPKFKWVGPISKNVFGLTAKKGRNIKIETFEDIKKYRIGGIRDDVALQILLERGIPKDCIQQVAKTKINIDKLNMNRIDLWAYGVNVAKWELKSSGFNLEDYEVVYILEDKYDLYYAINKDTSDKLVQDLQHAFDEVKRLGIYQQIMDRYLK